MFVLLASEFSLNLFLLLTKNVRSGNIYCGGRGRLLKFLIKSLREFLLLHPIIILIIFIFI